MKLKKTQWLGIGSGAIILILDLILFMDNERVLYFIGGIGVIIGVLPFVLKASLESKNEQRVNESFLEFTRNLAESVSTGTPISKSIINMRHRNYGVLNVPIVKLANQIELGIPLEKAFQAFARDVGSPVVERAVGLIREAERAGGEIDFILESTAKAISEVDKLKKERRSAIYSLVVEGYIIFFIFIGIILVMQFKILPLLSGIEGLPSLSGGVSSLQNYQAGSSESSAFSPEELTKPFLYLLITQGAFAGLIIGKLSEESIKAGVKHSFFLVIVAYLVSTGANLFLNVA